MMDALARLQALLRELFQYDLSDLDFGLYRLLRLKRDEVEAFLTEQLPQRVNTAFQGLAGAERATLQVRVEELVRDIRHELGDEAIAVNGEVSEQARGVNVRSVREMVEEYEQTRSRLQAVEATEDQKAEVFNHLYVFFSRYYDAGDFIPRRYRGAHESYAVPYNGEETYFHWANKDQHYVKTGEAFKDYTFTVEALGGPYRVRFTLVEASVPKDNTKGDMRFFFPMLDQLAWDVATNTFSVPFEYRLPTATELDHYGKNSKGQETLLVETEPQIRDAVSDVNLATALGTNVSHADAEPVTLLLKRLCHYTRRNTTDYFIHNHLALFLRKELEFYIKDQVLHLADLEGNLEGKRRMLRVLRQLAEDVITFLAQIEDMQKRIFEKRKFVLRTDYLLPIKEVPRELWPEVLSSKAQIQAWKDMFCIEPERNLQNPSGEINEIFLDEHPTLVVNTTHFLPEFTNRLLASYDDISEMIDGLLIEAENFQALRLLQKLYGGILKAVYIDPPYNTDKDDFVYKDRYKHSTWLAMMEERLTLARSLMSSEAVFFASIDDREGHNLKLLTDQVFSASNFVADIAVVNNLKGRSDREHIATAHEHLLMYAQEHFDSEGLSLTEEKVAEYKETDEHGRKYQWRDLRKRGGADTREQRPNLFFPIYYDLAAKSFSLEPITGNEIAIYPKKSDGSDGCWRWGMNKVKANLAKFKAEKVEEERWNVSYPVYLEVEGEQRTSKPKSVWLGAQYSTDLAQRALKALLPGASLKSPPKAVGFMVEIVEQSTGDEDTILDFFAGTGTTGQAVITCNRNDGERRKFILAEMGSHFHSMLMPRVQKVMYTPEWSDGKPDRLANDEEISNTPRIIKVISLEGYEDALHNLATDTLLQQQQAQADAYRMVLGDDVYRMQYMLRLPLDASDTMLNIAKLEHPFNYGLEVLTETGPQERKVDLVETFNFFYGLHVQRLEVWTNQADGRAYHAVKGRARDNRRVLVLWRDMTDLDPMVERAFLEAKLAEGEPFNEVLINGDTATPGVQSLDGLFKRLMEEGEA